MGLSPRVRGKHFSAIFSPLPRWSIPACAGEAGCRGLRLERSGVYPRVCGGSGYAYADLRVISGLSPRVRGKRRRPRQPDAPEGSIPACAGEAAEQLEFAMPGSVYPRVCGGSWRKEVTYSVDWGLSPRVRGKRAIDRMSLQEVWSIPACAGEAPASGGGSAPRAVYPACAGSVSRTRPGAWPRGLSPRVRGKLCPNCGLVVDVGSIPACAGEASPAQPGRAS